MCTKNLECPYKHPAVGMKLGGGDIELGEELPLEVGERKPKLHLLEHGGVDETKQLAAAPLIVRTDRFIR